jgi:hypothetical protein
MTDTVVKQVFQDGKILQFTIEELSDRVLRNAVINARYEKITPFFKETDETLLSGESWKPYSGKYSHSFKDKNVAISNLGSVRIDGQIAEQIDTAPLRGELYLKNYAENMKIWTLVAETWLTQDPDQEKACFEGENANIWDIHHITNDGYDNRPENLIWLKRALHHKIRRSR